LRFLYTLLLYLAAPLVSLLMFLRGLKDRSHWRNFGERLGLGPKLEPSGVWIHAVSVGEVQAIGPLVTIEANHPTADRDLGPELLGLRERAARQGLARDAGRKAQIILDA